MKDTPNGVSVDPECMAAADYIEALYETAHEILDNDGSRGHNNPIALMKAQKEMEVLLANGGPVSTEIRTMNRIQENIQNKIMNDEPLSEDELLELQEEDVIQKDDDGNWSLTPMGVTVWTLIKNRRSI